MNPYAQFGIEPPVQVSPHNLVVGEKYIVICTSFGLSAELFCDSIYLSMGDVIFCSENGRKTFVFQMNDPDVFIYEIF